MSARGYVKAKYKFDIKIVPFAIHRKLFNYWDTSVIRVHCNILASSLTPRIRVHIRVSRLELYQFWSNIENSERKHRERKKEKKKKGYQVFAP